MNWKEYSSLKSGSKVSFAKETVSGREFVVLITKRWDSSTGDAMDDSKREYSLADLETDKARYDADTVRAKAQSDGLALAITDFKKL